MKVLFDAIYARFLSEGKLGLTDFYTVEAPDDVEFPYGTYSTNITPDWTFTDIQEDCLLMFVLFSNIPGHTEVCAAFAALKAAFDFHDLDVTGYEPISLVREPAKLTRVEKIWQYNVNYRLLIEKVPPPPGFAGSVIEHSVVSGSLGRMRSVSCTTYLRSTTASVLTVE